MLSDKACERAWDLLDNEECFRESGFNHPLDLWQIVQGFSYQYGINGRSGGYVVMYEGGRKLSGYQSRCTNCGQLSYAEVLEDPDPADKEGLLYKYLVMHNHWIPSTYPNQDKVKALGLSDDKVVELIRGWRLKWGNDPGGIKEKPNVTYHNCCGRCRKRSRVNLGEPHTQVFTHPGRPIDQDVDFMDEDEYDHDDLVERVDLVWSFDEAVDQAIANFEAFCLTHHVERQVVSVPTEVNVIVEDEDIG